MLKVAHLELGQQWQVCYLLQQFLRDPGIALQVKLLQLRKRSDVAKNGAAGQLQIVQVREFL
jgi:hypothetical protein